MFVTCVRTRRCNFATERSIAKLKPPLCSAESKLPIGVKIPFSTKCGEWVIYAEPVTNMLSTRAPLLVCAGQNSPHRLKKRLTQLFDEAVWHQPSVLLLEKLDHAMPHVADAQEAVVDVDGSNGVKRAQGS